jgi:hypothetical protein
MNVREALIRSLRSAREHNPDVQTAPCCILWPDKDRQWHQIVPLLQDYMEELFVLGDYDPQSRTGPGIWLRCVIAGVIDPWKAFTDDLIPILYLPGLSRSELRIVEDCPVGLKPVIELQYRGTYWSQHSSKDWTPGAFFTSSWGGLNLQIAKDVKTREALQRSLPVLLDEEVESLQSLQLIDENTINSIGVPDLPKLMLQYINDGEAFKETVIPRTWSSFCSLCESKLSFKPDTEGHLAAAKALAIHTGPWRSIWERYVDTPHLYPLIIDRIRACSMPVPDLFVDLKQVEGWPQYTDSEEAQLLQSLISLHELTLDTFRSRILELEERHRERRNFLWAELGHAPLAMALKALAQLAQATEQLLPSSDIPVLQNAYAQWGWQTDDALLRVCASITQTSHEQPLFSVARSLYLPWAQEGAQKLQQLSLDADYPAEHHTDQPQYPESTCLLFVDGLRYDIAKRLTVALQARGHMIQESLRWAPFPSLTATGKPAISPVAHLITGGSIDTEGYPEVAQTRKSLRGGYHLNKLLKDSGWQVLDPSECGSGTGYAWTELGDVDHEGHAFGWKLVHRLDAIVQQVSMRVEELLKSGWKQVKIVTDHGWLLVPGGLPKAELPGALTEQSYGRCAVIKPGAITEVGRLPWYWNTFEFFAFAPGIHAFRQGEVYTHGGISLQESLLLELMVSGNEAPAAAGVRITEITWKGLRCAVIVSQASKSFTADIRTSVPDPASSVVFSTKNIREDGFVSLAVENVDLEGRKAYVVVLDSSGEIAAQEQTVIGAQG